MTRLLLVRHGESEFNNTHRFAGVVDIELTDNGRFQAERLRKRLASEKIDVVYTSSLKRARTTAEIVVSGRGLNIIECPELGEIHYGEVEGLTFSEIRQRYPTLADQIRQSDLNIEFPSGEKFSEFIKRVESFRKRLVKHGEEESLLIVAHGGPLRVLLLSLLSINQESWWQLRIDNASLSIVDTYPAIERKMKSESPISRNPEEMSRRVILTLFNETSYLV
jgi:alpha-ribazole phosphatase